MSQGEKRSDLNLDYLVDNLLHYFILKYRKNIEVWEIYGFKKMPTHGLILDMIFSKHYAYENEVHKTLLIISISSVMDAILSSNQSSDVKRYLGGRTLAKVFYLCSQSNSLNRLEKDFFQIYEELKKSKEFEEYIIFLDLVRERLSGKKYTKYIYGTMMLYGRSMIPSEKVIRDYIHDFIIQETKYQYEPFQMKIKREDVERYEKYIYYQLKNNYGRKEN